MAPEGRSPTSGLSRSRSVSVPGWETALLLTILSYLVVRHSGGSAADATAAALALETAFFLSFASLVLRPHEAVIGYKG